MLTIALWLVTGAIIVTGIIVLRQRRHDRRRRRERRRVGRARANIAYRQLWEQVMVRPRFKRLAPPAAARSLPQGKH